MVARKKVKKSRKKQINKKLKKSIKKKSKKNAVKKVKSKPKRKVTRKVKKKRSIKTVPKGPEPVKIPKELSKRESLLDVWKHHIFIFIISLAVLAIVFNANTTFITFIVISGLIVWLAHFFHFHRHTTYDEVIILGFFIVPSLLIIALFRDLFSIIIFSVYIISAITSIIIYYYHRKKHDIAKIMVKVSYSNLIGIAAALVLSYILQFALPRFYSIPELILIYFVPVLVVYFVISKYLYLHFFQKIHWFKDIKKALVYGLLYTLIFAIITTGIYAGFASNHLTSSTTEQTQSLEESYQFVSNLKQTYENLDPEVRSLTVVAEAEALVDNLLKEMDQYQKDLDITLEAGIDLDDNHFINLRTNEITALDLAIKEVVYSWTKEKLLAVHADLAELNESELQQELALLKGNVDNNPFLNNLALKQQNIDVIKALDEDISSEEMLDILSNDPRVYLSVIPVPKKESPFTYIYMNLFQHTIFYRESSRLTLLAIDIIDNKAFDTIVSFYEKKDVEESLLSKTIRYQMLDDHATKLAIT